MQKFLFKHPPTLVAFTPPSIKIDLKSLKTNPLRFSFALSSLSFSLSLIPKIVEIKVKPPAPLPFLPSHRLNPIPLKSSMRENERVFFRKLFFSDRYFTVTSQLCFEIKLSLLAVSCHQRKY